MSDASEVKFSADRSAMGEVTWSVDREGSLVTIAARQGGARLIVQLPARAAGAVAANLVLATAESGEGWETEFRTKGRLEVAKT
jgi:hypothetical protein